MKTKRRSFAGNLFLTLLLCLIASACDKGFLVVPVQGGESTASDPNLASKLVTGVYNSLLQGDSWGNGEVHGFAFISVTSIISDDADKGSTASDQAVPVGDIDNFTLTPTNKFCETLWSGHYNSIGAANQALAALATAAIDSAQQNEFVGEVRFLRGYLYFNLVRMYGGVPLVLRVPIDGKDANSDPALMFMPVLFWTCNTGLIICRCWRVRVMHQKGLRRPSWLKCICTKSNGTK